MNMGWKRGVFLTEQHYWELYWEALMKCAERNCKCYDKIETRSVIKVRLPESWLIVINEFLNRNSVNKLTLQNR
jgi:hypothetical protein